MRGLVFAGVVAAILAAGSCRADVSFYDGTFSPSDWQISYWATGGGGTAGAEQIFSRGLPVPCWSTTIGVNNPDPVFGSHVCAATTRSSWTYSPSIQGAISSIDYSFSREGGGAATGIALVQAGTIYYGSATVGGSPWSTVAFSGLHASDFGDRYGSGAHPDFSSAGQCMYFGFWIANSSSPGYWGYASTTNIDNFGIGLHTVPEPSAITVLLCGIGGIGGMMWRRRAEGGER